jgi:diguanylate cyclase (GGDEF)-like protein
VRIRKDGTRIDIALTLSPVQDKKGSIVGVSSIAREITTRKQADEALRQSHAQLERQTHQLKLMAEMSEMVQASSVPADAYAVTARFVQTLIPASSGALFVHSASKDILEVVLRWGGPHPNEEDSLATDECWGLRTGRVHLVEDSLTGLLCRHLPEPPPASYVCAPMIAHGETLGLLHVQIEGDQHASAVPGLLELTWPVRTMAERLALALADMKLREALRAQSICDPLTGWYNRRHMQETLERDIRRAPRTQRPLTLLMFDIDNFKEFNDSFGHEAGDVALQTLCQIVKTLIRGEDVACRYGGDEFVLILPDSSTELATQRAEDMRIAVGQAEMQFQSHMLKPMTLSFGIATFPADATTSHELLRAADTALYRAKSEGRDRVRARKAPEITTKS